MKFVKDLHYLLLCLISDLVIALTFCVKFIPTGSMFSFKIGYRKILKISPGAYVFQRPFLRGLFLEGLVFGGAYL